MSQLWLEHGYKTDFRSAQVNGVVQYASVSLFRTKEPAHHLIISIRRTRVVQPVRAQLLGHVKNSTVPAAREYGEINHFPSRC